MEPEAVLVNALSEKILFFTWTSAFACNLSKIYVKIGLVHLEKVRPPSDHYTVPLSRLEFPSKRGITSQNRHFPLGF